MTPPVVSHAGLKDVRLLLLDVDGVLTDGRLWFGPDGPAAKAFHVRDGLGITLLHKAGIAVCIVSGRDEAGVRRRAAELGIREVRLAVTDKGTAVREILADAGVAPAQAAFLADDVNDVPALQAVGVPIAVADAHPDVLAFVRFQTRAPGGNGAVREVADAILGPWQPAAAPGGAQ